MSDNDLGLFLRTRREALTPGEAGLPAGPRRRTPGLRRAEVAMLAGVSVEYLTRLEQGRDRHPSVQVLSALADALHLGFAERVHLYRLAKGADGSFMCKDYPQPGREVRPALRKVIEQLEPAPCVLLNGLSDVLGYTSGYERLMGPTGLLRDKEPNLARWLFIEPMARAVLRDWDLVADEQVARLKQGPFRADQRAIEALADELTVTAGDAFATRAANMPGLPAASGVLRYVHPEAGELRLSYETLDLPADDQRLVVYLGADATTSAALDRLCRPGPRPLGVASR